MSELIENLELEAHYLYKSTPGFNRKQRGFVYHVDIYEAFVRLTEKGIKKPIIIVASMLKYIEKIEKLDVPMNKRLTYMIAMYEYLVSKGEL